MAALPAHGRIECTKCFKCERTVFDSTQRTDTGWRITANPLAWGNANADTVILGFSKGPTQAGALTNTPHDQIAFKGSRSNVAKILAHIGLLDVPPGTDPAAIVERAIADRSGRFHFGSLIRCTVERFDRAHQCWKGSGGGMLDRFVATLFGQEVTKNCMQQYLAALPDRTKLIVMFGLGSKLNYVNAAFDLYRTVREGRWTRVNDVAYTDGKLIVVHVEHFASQGALIPQWLGQDGHARGRYGTQARDAVRAAFKVPE